MITDMETKEMTPIETLIMSHQIVLLTYTPVDEIPTCGFVRLHSVTHVFFH